MSDFQCAENVVSPASPPTGMLSLYAKADGLWYYKDSTGLERSLRGPQGGSTYDVIGWYSAVLPPAYDYVSLRIARGLSYPTDFANSIAIAEVAATASTVLSVQKNNVQFGTITFGAGSTIGVFVAPATTFALGDRLSIVTPPADATLAGVAVTLNGDGAIGAFDLVGGTRGLSEANAKVLVHKVARGFTLPAGLTNSQGVALVASAAASSYSIQNNGVAIGTMDFALGATNASFTFANATSFVTGDLLTIVAPNPVDASLADIDITLAGSF